MSKTTLPKDSTSRIDPPEARTVPTPQMSKRARIEPSVRPPRTARRSRLIRRLVFACGTLLMIGGSVYGVSKLAGSFFVSTGSDVATSAVKVMTLRDVIIEQGTLESQNTINGVCQVRGYENKIIFLLAEGTKVKKGDVVVRFDDSNIKKNIEEQELQINQAKSEMEDAEQEVTVQKNTNESSIRTAKQAYEFAKIDLNKYLLGDFEVSKSDYEGSISESNTAVKKAERELEAMRIYVKRGFRQYEQLREAEQVLESAKLRLKRDKQKYDMLIRFDHKKRKAELEGKVTEAEFKLQSEKETADAKLSKAEDRFKARKRRYEMNLERLEDYKKNLDNFTIKAPQDGTVAYPTENMYGPNNRIREGGIVYQNQVVFYLPNMQKMQVVVNVHESMVSKVKVGQKVTIRADAFSNVVLNGVVKKVATLAENSFFTTAKNYKATVVIDKVPDSISLKPGMTAKVEIVCGIYPDVTCLPIQAVTTKFGRTYAYVKNSDGFERREIKIDRANVSFIEVVEGLQEGDVVALDAFQRSIEDFAGVVADEFLAGNDDETATSQETSVDPESGETVPDTDLVVQTSEEAKAEDDSNKKPVGDSDELEQENLAIEEDDSVQEGSDGENLTEQKKPTELEDSPDQKEIKGKKSEKEDQVATERKDAPMDAEKPSAEQKGRKEQSSTSEKPISNYEAKAAQAENKSGDTQQEKNGTDSIRKEVPDSPSKD